MGYERRGASFNFMGSFPVGRTYRIVEDDEEVPVLMRPPSMKRESAQGTITLPWADFARERRAIRFAAVPPRSDA